MPATQVWLCEALTKVVTSKDHVIQTKQICRLWTFLEGLFGKIILPLRLVSLKDRNAGLFIASLQTTGIDMKDTESEGAPGSSHPSHEQVKVILTYTEDTANIAVNWHIHKKRKKKPS